MMQAIREGNRVKVKKIILDTSGIDMDVNL